MDGVRPAFIVTRVGVPSLPIVSWYQDMAKKQKGKRRLKSAGLQVNKFLR